jgi:hypothetical protein
VTAGHGGAAATAANRWYRGRRHAPEARSRVLAPRGWAAARHRRELADILTRFAQATGAEVVYEAPRPRQLVSVVIEAASPAEAITRLLEGQGLNYALRLDHTGRNVEMLILTGAASPAAAPAAAARSPRASPPTFPPPEELDEIEPAEVEMPLAPEAAESPGPTESPGPVPADLMNPALGLPSALPGAPTGGESFSAVPPSGYVAPEPGQPQPPAAASYPGSPPLPSPPVYPGPTSYPDRT